MNGARWRVLRGTTGDFILHRPVGQSSEYFRRYFVAQQLHPIRHDASGCNRHGTLLRYRPIMCLLSSLTISRGVISDMRGPYAFGGQFFNSVGSG